MRNLTFESIARGHAFIYTFGGSQSESQTYSHMVLDDRKLHSHREGHVMGDLPQADMWTLSDSVGSCTATLDDTGQIVSVEGYYLFGETAWGSYAKKRYRYCGKERDGETGLYYYGARYYDAWTCRFVSVDPLADKYAQLSTYNYADNNPITDYDIDGRQGTGTPPAAPANEGSGQSSQPAATTRLQLNIKNPTRYTGAKPPFVPKPPSTEASADNTRNQLPIKREYNIALGLKPKNEKVQAYTEPPKIGELIKHGFSRADAALAKLKGADSSSQAGAILTTPGGNPVQDPQENKVKPEKVDIVEGALITANNSDLPKVFDFASKIQSAYELNGSYQKLQDDMTKSQARRWEIAKDSIIKADTLTGIMVSAPKIAGSNDSTVTGFREIRTKHGILVRIKPYGTKSEILK